MRGSGLGGVFGRLFRSSIPYLKSLGRYAGRQLLESGADTIQDIKQGMAPRRALQKNITKTKDRIVSTIKRKLSGGGRNRSRKKRRIVKPKKQPKRLTRKRKRRRKTKKQPGLPF